VQADFSKKGVVVEKAISTAISPKELFWGRIVDSNSMISHMAETIKKKKIKGDIASINLPMQFCDLKAYDFPKGYMKKSSLDWEIEQNFIEDTRGYRFDHIEAGRSKKGVYDILVSAIAEAVDERAALLPTLGYAPVGIDPDILCFYNGIVSTMGDFPAKSVLLVDISYPYSSFALVRDNVFLPGVHLKVKEDLVGNKVFDAIPEFALHIVKAFTRRYELIGFDMVKNKPEMLMVSGSYVDTNVADYFAVELELPLYKKNPLESSAFKMKDKKTPLSWHQYIKPLGLALRS